MFRTSAAIVLFAAISTAAFAQSTLPPEFVTCSRIQKNSERLACYDRATAYLSQPDEQQAAAPSAESSFGLQAGAPQPPAAAATDESKDEGVSSIVARVTEAGLDREGKATVTLDNGQTWRELARSGYLALEVGDEVTIKRAALGSFMLSPPNGRPVRVRRIK